MSERSRGVTVGIGVGVVVAIAVALGIAVAAGGGDSGSGDAQQVAFVAVNGEPLPQFSGAGGPDDPAIGQQAPRLRGANFADERVEVGGATGRGQVIGFFAHWCPHCQAELPRLADWLGSHTVPDAVDVVAVSTSADRGAPNYPPSSWFDETGWPEPVLVDSDAGDAAVAYGLSGFPYFVVLDGDGEVLARVSGELDTAQWQTLLDLAASGSADTSGLVGGESSETRGGE